MTDIGTILLGAIGAAGIGFTWYLKVRPQGEQINWAKLGQSGLFGGFAGVVMTLLGIGITDTSVITWLDNAGLSQFIMNNGTDLAVLISGVGTAIFGGSFGLMAENIWKALGLKTFDAAKVKTVVTPGTTDVVVTSSAPNVSAATNVASGSPIYQGICKVLGIYGHSAGQTPQQSLEFDVNMIPTLFFDIECVETGTVAMKLVIDNIMQKKWMPDTSIESGIRTTKMGTVGQKMPMSFVFPPDRRTPGDHAIVVMTGTSTVNDEVNWLKQDKFTIKFTGEKFAE